jgi:hypothetical protein
LIQFDNPWFFLLISRHTLAYIGTYVGRVAYQVAFVTSADIAARDFLFYPDSCSHMVAVMQQDDLLFQQAAD